MRAIPEETAAFVKGQEGEPKTVYRDIGGKLTGGIGHLLSDSEIPSWPEGTPVSDAQAQAWLASDLDDARAKLYNKVTAEVLEVELTENQWAALLDFAFNEGTPGTTIYKRLNSKQFDQVPVELMRFVYARVGGKEVKVSDLVRRRTDEIKLWSTAEPGSVEAVIPSSVTRIVATPPAPTDPRPRGGIGPAIATALASMGAAATQAQGAVKAVSDALSPFADSNDHIKAALSTLALVAAGLAVLTLVLVYLRNRSVSRWEKTTMPSLPATALPPPQGQPNAPVQQPQQ